VSRIISCRTSVYGKPEDAFRLAPDAGITCVELCGVGPDGFADAKAEAARHGVDIGTIGANVNLSDADNIAAFGNMMQKAADAGIVKLFTSVGGKLDDDGRDALIEKLQGVCAQAEQLGLLICMETHPPFGKNGADAVTTIREVGSKALRMNFDTANVYYYNESINGVDELTKAIDVVETLHLKDTDGGFHSANFPVLGQGIVDFPNTFRLCDDAGIPGPFTLELEGPLTSGKSLDERQAAVKACMAYLADIGAI